jgi:hypothetical protein
MGSRAFARPSPPAGARETEEAAPVLLPPKKLTPEREAGDWGWTKGYPLPDLCPPGGRAIKEEIMGWLISFPSARHLISNQAR